ncbi:hypothetical protein K438DRAFT_1963108 [Mycena galopus ATCC 62051]|nr:hypothetical protein K438DRAFT_1963108 [Mycena galopus ATCC 62051]
MQTMQNTTPATGSHPFLPPELERAIFEIAALASHSTIPILVLVAARVKQWVEPLLYRIIVVHTRHYKLEYLGLPLFSVKDVLRLIATKTPDLLRQSVKELFLGGPLETRVILTICTAFNRVVNLFEQAGRNFNPVSLSGLRHLRRLVIPLAHFFRCCTTESTRSLLNNITHLDLGGHSDDDLSMQNLISYFPFMPHVTHIALQYIPSYPPVHEALCTNANLRCIIFYVDSEEETKPGTLWKDARFLCIIQEIDFRHD